MNWRRWIVRILLGFLMLLLGIALVAGSLWWYYHPSYTRTHAVVYGHRSGRDLLLDVVTPSSPNGLGVVLVVSGGWKSGTNSFRPWMVAPLLRRGYTVFPVCHISPPNATVTEIAADIHRGVRFIRHHSSEYHIDPRHLGITGGSAGGHLRACFKKR